MDEANKITVADLLDYVAAKICDDYCKYPEQYGEDNEEELYKYCEKCPLSRLGI